MEVLFNHLQCVLGASNREHARLDSVLDCYYQLLVVDSALLVKMLVV